MTALKNRSAFDVDTDRSSGEWDERQLTYFFPIHECIGLSIARTPGKSGDERNTTQTRLS
jgi:hypothetical protein